MERHVTLFYFSRMTLLHVQVSSIARLQKNKVMCRSTQLAVEVCVNQFHEERDQLSTSDLDIEEIWNKLQIEN